MALARFPYSPAPPRSFGSKGHIDPDDEDYGRRNAHSATLHQPTRPVDKEKNEAELSLNIKKATSPEETAPSGC